MKDDPTLQDKLRVNRRGFFGAIAAALGCARAPVWKRDPNRCAWHDAAGGVITDQELADAGSSLSEIQWSRTEVQMLLAETIVVAHPPMLYCESTPSGAGDYWRRTYLNSRYGRVLEISKELLDDDAFRLCAQRREG